MYTKKTNKDSSRQAVKSTSNNIQRSLSGLPASYLSNRNSISQLKNIDTPVVSEHINYSSNSIFPKEQLNIQNSPPAFLPCDTPAWSDRGNIGIGPAFFQADHEKRSEIMRHESIHSIQQNRSNVDNSSSSRKHAEGLATGKETLNAQSLTRPAPGLLAFPVQTHKPWDKVYIGNTGIIGELVQSGITLRIRLDYSEFKIKDIYKHDKSLGMDIIDKPRHSIYHCGKHPNKNLDAKVKKLKQVMSKIERLNKKIPSSSTFKIQYVFISKHTSERYRTANKKGILFLATTTLNTSIIDAAAHEASHGIFEHHASAGDKDPGKRVPDNFALRITDIFTRLRATKSAAMPDKKFNPKTPPAFSSKSGATAPSGIIPIHDSVWSGSGGHPTSVDEFFASSFAAYVQVPKLLTTMINHYNKHDNTIKPIYTELLGLFKKVGSPKDLKSIAEPTEKKKALSALVNISAPLDYTDPSQIAASDEAFFNPSSLKGPGSIKCKP